VILVLTRIDRLGKSHRLDRLWGPDSLVAEFKLLSRSKHVPSVISDCVPEGAKSILKVVGTTCGIKYGSLTAVSNV
jgi:hypothetical protein